MSPKTAQVSVKPAATHNEDKLKSATVKAGIWSEIAYSRQTVKYLFANAGSLKF